MLDWQLCQICYPLEIKLLLLLLLLLFNGAVVSSPYSRVPRVSNGIVKRRPIGTRATGFYGKIGKIIAFIPAAINSPYSRAPRVSNGIAKRFPIDAHAAGFYGEIVKTIILTPTTDLY